MANNDEMQSTAPAVDPKDAEIAKLKKLLKASEKKSAESEAARADAEQKAAEAQKELTDLKAAREKTPDAAARDTGKVTIRLYKDQNIKDDVQVFVNGRQYIIRRGVDVAVLREVFEVLQNQEKMRNHIADYNAKHAQE